MQGSSQWTIYSVIYFVQIVQFHFWCSAGFFSLPFLFLKTNPDFETIYSLQNRVASIPTSASKSLTENGRSQQPPIDELQRSRGSTCTSSTGSDKLSPVSTPRGEKYIIIFTHKYDAFDRFLAQHIQCTFPSVQNISWPLYHCCNCFPMTMLYF